MEGLKHIASIFCVYFIGKASGVCMLDRDEYNRFPFMLKLVYQNVVRCHGALITPKYFIGPFSPVRDIIEDATLLPRMYVIGQLNGRYGRLCKNVRRTEVAVRDGDRNLFFGTLAKGFEVTPNQPYLYPQIDDYNFTKIVNNFEKIPDYDCCIVPVFDGSTPIGNILETSVTYVKGAKINRWWNLFCRNSSKCGTLTRSENFLALDPVDRSKDFSWYQGAIIVCNGKPLGMMSNLIEDTSSNVKITMFQHIAFYAANFREHAEREWPKYSLERTTPTQKATTARTERTAAKERTSRKGADAGIGVSVKLVLKQSKDGSEIWMNGAVGVFRGITNNLVICISIHSVRAFHVNE